MNWSLVTIRQGSTTSLAVRREDGSLVAPPDLKRWPTMLELLDDWDTARPVLQNLDIDTAPSSTADQILTPISWPRKVVCAGVNYRKHIREMAGEVPGDSWGPVLLPQTPHHHRHRTHRPHRDQEHRNLPVRLGGRTRRHHRPRRAGHRRGRRPGPCGRLLRRERCHRPRTPPPRHRRGPGRGVPVRLVRLQGHRRVPAPGPRRHPRLPGARPTEPAAAALGERGTAAGRIHPGHDLHGGRTDLGRQPHHHPEPGDVIPTGTPSGVGAGRGLYLKAGDVVRTSIDGLGALINPVTHA